MCSVLKLSCNHCSNYPTWDPMFLVWSRKTWPGICMDWSSLWRSRFFSLGLMGHHHSLNTHYLLFQWPLQVHKRVIKKGENTSVRGQGWAGLTFRIKTNRWDPGNLQGYVYILSICWSPCLKYFWKPPKYLAASELFLMPLSFQLFC